MTLRSIGWGLAAECRYNGAEGPDQRSGGSLNAPYALQAGTSPTRNAVTRLRPRTRAGIKNTSGRPQPNQCCGFYRTTQRNFHELFNRFCNRHSRRSPDRLRPSNRSHTARCHDRTRTGWRTWRHRCDRINGFHRFHRFHRFRRLHGIYRIYRCHGRSGGHRSHRLNR
jgi:hypothetical protein